jgi:hypothetical protein
MLELCVVSFEAHHYLTHRDDPSPGVLLYVALFSFKYGALWQEYRRAVPRRIVPFLY